MCFIYKDHCERIEKIKKFKINGKFPKYREIWECRFDKELSSNTKLASFLKKNKYKEPLNIEEALRGGRVETIKLYHECNLFEKKKMHYYDVCSMYPGVQKYSKFPTAHPRIITENFPDINDIFGVLNVKILPPKNLHIPNLPCKIESKLLFPLCYTCAKEKLNVCPNHTDEERAIEGVYISEELKMAIKDGYKIMEIYEVWDFETVTQYNKDTKTGGMFTKYINMFLKSRKKLF